MTDDLLDKLTDAIADDVARKASEKLLSFLEAKASKPVDDPLIGVVEIAKMLNVSVSSARRLVQSGAILRPDGMRDIRVRRSEVQRYGTSK